MIDKNKKLAKFLGQENQPYDFPQFGYINSSCKWVDEFNENELKFDTDWRWLMHLVDKIENIVLPVTDNCFNVSIGPGLYCTIQDAYGELIEINTNETTKKLTVYNACVNFVEWYEMQR